ncbi:hypothetical protein Tco_1448050, partial [Tanacetum coccineum]
MLDKDLYDSWKSQMELYMKNREPGRMILESVEHGPLIWPTVEENGVIRTNKYAKLSAAEKIQADYDMKATNIILQGLPADIYSLERECKLYDAFDKFTHIKWESLHTYYLRFTHLINDINIYKMKMEQFQANTKFLNRLLPEWSKFVTDVKLVKDLHTSNFDQLHAYLKQHEFQANEVRSLIPIINSELPLIQETKPLFKMAGLPCNKFRGDKGKIILEKAMLAEAQEAGQILDEEQLAFFADPRILASQAQTIIPHNAAFQTEDLDTYNSDWDDLSTAQ